MANSQLDYLHNQISEHIENLMEDLADGIPDHGTYQRMCGVIRGLRISLDIVREFEKKLLDD